MKFREVAADPITHECSIDANRAMHSSSKGLSRHRTFSPVKRAFRHLEGARNVLQRLRFQWSSMRRYLRKYEGIVVYDFYTGEGRSQGSLFWIVLDDLIPVDHMCRVLDAFVAMLALSELGFERAQAAKTGRPGYDPRDLLKLYLYGHSNQIRSS